MSPPPLDEAIALRARLDVFVGRAEDLAAIQARFDGGARALTLVGPPGVGKTRLACEYAAERAARGDHDSVHFCDLAAARDRDEVCAAVARALRVESAAGAAQVGAALAARGDALVVLDNLEHAVACAPETVQRWMALCPSARLLVTSREVLRVPGEVVYELGPLDTGARDVDATSEAAALLIARVERARGGWSPTTAERAAIGEIARLLDGLPLAIELAAARVVMLGADAVLARLDRRLELLTHGARGAPARQGTLRGSFDASWELLTPTERLAAAQGSVFRGGFTLEAAEAVLELGGDAPSAVSAVQSLREKSWLRDEGGDARRGRRFGMYLCVHEYLARRAGAAAPALARRHAAHYADLGEREAARLDGHEGPAAAARLAAERDNLLAAADAALADGDAELALRALLALDRVHPPSDAHLALFDRVLHLAERQGTSPARVGQLLAARADALRRRGRVEESERDLARALALARDASDPNLEAACLACQGALLGNQGRYDASRATMERLLAAGAGRRYERRAHASLGVTCFELGLLAEAEAHLARARALCHEAGDGWLEAMVLGNLGVLLVHFARNDEALRCFDAAAAIVPRPEVNWIWGQLRCQLGTLHAARGDLDPAYACFSEGTRALRQAGNTRAAAGYSVYLGALELLRGDVAEAEATLREALDAVQRADNGTYRAFGAALRAAALVVAGDLPQAERAEAAAAALADRAPAARARGLAGAVRALGAVVLHARAEAALAGGAAAEAAALRAESRRRRREAEALAAGGEVAALDLRVALQVVDYALAGDAPDEPAAPHDGALELDRRRALVRLPDGRAVRFGRRRTLWLLLLALADRRAARPGEAVTRDELRAAGWPGERMSAAVARNRLHVSLSTLRALGLRDLLRASEAGYALDPEVALRDVDRA